MPTPIQPTTKPVCLSFSDAAHTLDNPVVRRAYLVDAVTVGLHMVNESQNRGYSTMLRVLMTSVADDHIFFAVFEGRTRVAMMCYSWIPDEQGSPVLIETDSRRVPLGETPRSRELSPVFDHVLANLEQQVWNRVSFA